MFLGVGGQECKVVFAPLRSNDMKGFGCMGKKPLVATLPQSKHEFALLKAFVPDARLVYCGLVALISGV